MEAAEVAIKQCVENNSENLNPVVARFQDNLDRGEHSLMNSLEEKRNQKMLRLNPVLSPSMGTHTPSHTHTPSRTSSQTRTHPRPRTPQVEKGVREMGSADGVGTPYQRWNGGRRVNTRTSRSISTPLLPNPRPNMARPDSMSPMEEGYPFGAHLEDIRDTLKSLVSRFNAHVHVITREPSPPLAPFRLSLPVSTIAKTHPNRPRASPPLNLIHPTGPRASLSPILGQSKWTNGACMADAVSDVETDVREEYIYDVMRNVN